MRLRVSTILVTALLCLAPSASWADLASYSQDFEGLTPAPQALPETSLGDDGWLLWVNVFDANGGYLYNYGAVFPAPNHGGAISAVVGGQGGLPQGAQQLSVFSDYNNGDHGACELGPNGFDSSSPFCKFIEVNVYQEQVIGAADVGTTWRFDFDAKRGNIEGATTALAFFKVLNPFAGYSLTKFVWIDMTDVSPTWNSESLPIFIEPGWEGQILQFGFLNTATAYEGSGIFYDNINFDLAPLGVSLDIRPEGCPNPINGRTRGVIPVAVLGTADFDVNDIDVASLQLEGVAPILSGYEDVAEPYTGALCGCTEAGPDGFDDLTLKFRAQDLVGAIAPLEHGERVLTLTGTLLDGTEIEGQDCMVTVGGGNGAGSPEAVRRDSTSRRLRDGDVNRREARAE